MRNIGPKSAELLRRIGVRSREELSLVGVAPAFLMVRQAGANPSLNLLWAMEGAVRDADWRAIPSARKQELITELEGLTQPCPVRRNEEGS